MSACKYHPNGPTVVSPTWIVASTLRGRLQPPSLFPPRVSLSLSGKKRKSARDDGDDRVDVVTSAKKKRRRRNDTENDNVTSKTIKTSSERTARPKPKSSTTKSLSCHSSIFQGALFVILQKSPSLQSSRDEFVDFDPTELESIIISNGGHILTSSIINILRKEASSSSSLHRICYVVHSGAEHNNNNVDDTSNILPPLLSPPPQLDELLHSRLCDIHQVTPIWIRTCVTEKIEVDPENYHPVLFRPPSSGSIHKLPQQHHDDDTVSRKKKLIIKVAVTGFVGPERTGIAYLLKWIGADYTENMSRNNTHLICKLPSSKQKDDDDAVKRENHHPSSRLAVGGGGAKFQKALEWGLHVVSVDWLYHIVRFGFEVGCEEKFSLSANKKDPSHKDEKGSNNDKRKETLPITKPCSDNNNNKGDNEDKEHQEDQPKDSAPTTKADEHRLRSNFQALENPLPPPNNEGNNNNNNNNSNGNTNKNIHDSRDPIGFHHRHHHRQRRLRQQKQKQQRQQQQQQDRLSTTPGGVEPTPDESSESGDDDSSFLPSQVDRRRSAILRKEVLARHTTEERGGDGNYNTPSESQVVWYGERTQQN